MNIVKLTTAKPFKKFISELDSKEIEIVEAYLNRLVAKEVADRTVEHNFEINQLNEQLKDKDYFQGFYWSQIGEIKYYNLTEQHIDGINDGLKHLATKPDKIVQHYGDPNPKVKIYQHRKSN